MGYGYEGYSQPNYSADKCGGYGNTFVLIVVLFILLIIVGATFSFN